MKKEVEDIKTDLQSKNTFIWNFLFNIIIISVLQVNVHEKYYTFLKRPFIVNNLLYTWMPQVNSQLDT